MTIAGSDSSGSSGLQADLPTLAALGTHATTVVTVVTAQNSTGVQAFHPLPPELIQAQIDSLLDDLAPSATKTGLLIEVPTIELVAARAGRLGALVVDPVMVNSQGDLIVSPDAVAAYRGLCSSAAAITPNRSELEILLGLDERLHSVMAIEDVTEEIRGLGAAMVVVTGGRSDSDEVVDVVVTATDVSLLTSPRVGSGPIRGTGCTFSAALTAELARDTPPQEAAKAAHQAVQEQLERLDSSPRGAGLAGLPHVTN